MCCFLLEQSSGSMLGKFETSCGNHRGGKTVHTTHARTYRMGWKGTCHCRVVLGNAVNSVLPGPTLHCPVCLSFAPDGGGGGKRQLDSAVSVWAHGYSSPKGHMGHDLVMGLVGQVDGWT